MKRYHADILLGIAGVIWGFAFVAQKDVIDSIGPFTFVAARFLISALFVLPFTMREGGLVTFAAKSSFHDLKKVIALGLFLALAVVLQQFGLMTTTVTNSSFLTGLYIIFVPFVSVLIYRQKLSVVSIFGCVLSFFGVWLLTGVDPSNFLATLNRGDALTVGCALFFAMQIVVMGHIAGRMKKPFILSFLQYGITGLLALMFAFCLETIDLHALAAAWGPILYAGVASGGVAYTLQALAQQHAPTVDAAILMSSESLFGAIGGAWLLHEKLAFSAYLGCAAIMLAIVLVEVFPLFQARFVRS